MGNKNSAQSKNNRSSKLSGVGPMRSTKLEIGNVA